MIYVRRLTVQQKDLLIGKVWGLDDQEFGPKQDINNEWYISEQEVQGCTLAQAQSIGCDSWLLTLPIVVLQPKITNLTI